MFTNQTCGDFSSAEKLPGASASTFELNGFEPAQNRQSEIITMAAGGGRPDGLLSTVLTIR